LATSKDTSNDTACQPTNSSLKMRTSCLTMALLPVVRVALAASVVPSTDNAYNLIVTEPPSFVRPYVIPDLSGCCGRPHQRCYPRSNQQLVFRWCLFLAPAECSKLYVSIRDLHPLYALHTDPPSQTSVLVTAISTKRRHTTTPASMRRSSATRARSLSGPTAKPECSPRRTLAACRLCRTTPTPSPSQTAPS